MGREVSVSTSRISTLSGSRRMPPPTRSQVLADSATNTGGLGHYVE
jgi:hypothetical protein